MAKTVTLRNGRKWSTQTDALNHFKQMLGRYMTSQRVTDPDDHADLVALLERYDATIVDTSESKTGCGVDYFSKQRNAGMGYSTDGFWVHRTDGTAIDFSYISAVKSAAA